MENQRGSREAKELRLLYPRWVSQQLPVQRFGVTTDQCTGCGGIFLDLGESEQLTEAERRLPQRRPPGGYVPQPYAARPMYVERPRQGGFVGGLFSGGGYYGGRHGGHH